MTSVLLVPDLPSERWPSMDRYASRLAAHLKRAVHDIDVRVAGEIAALTLEDQSADTPAAGAPVLPRLPTPGLSELRRYVARYVVYPRRVKKLQGDVFHVLDHSYAHLLLGRRTRPAVVTVHDLLPVFTVESKAGTMRSRLRRWLLTRVLDGLRRADAWIVATDWMRDELARWLGRDYGIWVVPFGVDDAFFSAPSDPRPLIRVRLGLPSDAFVVLHVGSVGPRKNLPTVFAAVESLRQTGVNAWLLQVGGELTQAQEKELETRGLARRTVALGATQEIQLREAYHAADILLFPSLYEGFGFPVLEAMASGLPVVTSGAGGLADVAGDAAVVVGGRETAPYVTALRRVVQSPHWRHKLVARGIERAKQFRWADTARRTAEVYREVAR
jgi:glycosyltransferase involved in cell wall biosynthesis